MAFGRVEEIVAGVRDTAAGSGLGGVSLPELLCAACAGSLPVSGVGLSLMTGQGPAGTVAATDGVARILEEAQFTLCEGPCVDAYSSGGPVLHPDLARTGLCRWPGYTPAALDAGVRAVFAFPLQIGGIRLGVLDLYRDTSGVLDGAELTEALAFADAATVIVLQVQQQAPAGQVHPLLSDPRSAHTQVHQATGMVSVQAAVGLVEALLLLRAHAFAAELPIAAVARDVVTRVLRFDRNGQNNDHSDE